MAPAWITNGPIPARLETGARNARQVEYNPIEAISLNYLLRGVRHPALSSFQAFLQSNPRFDLPLVLGWALCLRLLFAALTANTYDPDEFVYLSLSHTLAHGAVPYHDFMFFHPPGVLSLFRWLEPVVTWWWPSARMVVLLIDTLTAVLVWRIGTVLYGRGAALAAGLIYGASPLALLCAVRVDQDPIMTALGIAGLVILLTTRSLPGAALAGCCLGLAVWFKYPALVFVPVYVLAAPRRAWISILAGMVVLAVAFIPYAGDLHDLVSQTVQWQLWHRTPTAVPQRVIATLAFWLLLNPFTLPAIFRRRYPIWLTVGFGLGGVFMFSSQVYYHYFVAAVPFAALLAAPFVLRIVRGAPLIAAAGALIASVLFATDIAAGSAPARLFITAASFSSLHNTVQILDRSTSPNQPVLTDQFEYSYLAHRPSLDDYFWNMHDVVKAHDLENRLLNASAVVRTKRVAPTYPRGFIEYLEGHGYRRAQTGLTEVWLLSSPRVADVFAAYGAGVDTSSDRANHRMLSVRPKDWPLYRRAGPGGT